MFKMYLEWGVLVFFVPVKTSQDLLRYVRVCKISGRLQNTIANVNIAKRRQKHPLLFDWKLWNLQRSSLYKPLCVYITKICIHPINFNYIELLREKRVRVCVREELCLCPAAQCACSQKCCCFLISTLKVNV